MASNNRASKAEKTASASKKNKNTKTQTKKAASQKENAAQAQNESFLPKNIVLALICLGLFIVFLVKSMLLH